jgi:uncharacterized protein YwgA
MNRLQRAAVLTELMDHLRAHGSWCGETHVQKAVYFLQDVLRVPTGFEYILYKYGPYSFDLTEELTALRADYLIQLDHKSPGYGPALVPTATSAALRERYPKTLDEYRAQIAFLAEVFDSKGVADLEKLATALYVTRELAEGADCSGRARRLCELKPHVSQSDALAAIQQFDRIVAKARDAIQQCGISA